MAKKKLKVGKVDLKALKKDRKKHGGSPFYRVIGDGDDAVILFGEKYKKMSVSDIGLIEPDYLEWIIEHTSFPDELKNICKKFCDYDSTPDGIDILGIS